MSVIQENWLEIESQKTLKRIEPVLRRILDEDDVAQVVLFDRLQRHFGKLFTALHELYGTRYDFFYFLQELLVSMVESWKERDDALKALDAAREDDPTWFQSNRMLGAMCYVDLFSDTISQMQDSVPYLRELGVNYLHLMPMFKSPDGDDDGGYAVSSYRELNTEYGTIDELQELAASLRVHGISLALDFICNHTSDEHEWAKKARSGDIDFQQYYRMYPDRKLPDQFEKHLPEIFPDEHPGAFTYVPSVKNWVWTTFHTYQWDLNYENPAVFVAMAEELLFLANLGTEVIRLDAVAYIWKKLGTSCMNLPEAHKLIQAFNSVLSIACPAVSLKSEAIVHPDEVNKYVSSDECELSYNPNVMALIWSSLATRDITLLKTSIEKRFSIPDDCAWVNYVRCHDDIGWGFSDEDAIELGIDPGKHRRFLNDFYTGKFPGSFAKGLPFQANEKTGDMRISGTTASLCGLETAIEAEDDELVELAIARILLIHGVVLTLGGIPLIYLGDELGMMNSYAFRQDPDTSGDSRWVHRFAFDWFKAETRNNEEELAGKVYTRLLRLIHLRTQTLAFARAETEVIDTSNRHILGYLRSHKEQTVLVLANFSEEVQTIPANLLRQRGLRKVVSDIVTGTTVVATDAVELQPYQFSVLVGVR